MAYSKKSTRPIRVDGHDYRWLVRQEEDLTPTLVIRSADHLGQRVRATFAGERAFADEGEVAALGIKYTWGSNEVGIYYQPTRAISPRVVAAVIGDALTHGWQPTQQGADVRLRLRAPSEVGHDT